MTSVSYAKVPCYAVSMSHIRLTAISIVSPRCFQPLGAGTVRKKRLWTLWNLVMSLLQLWAWVSRPKFLTWGIHPMHWLVRSRQSAIAPSGTLHRQQRPMKWKFVAALKWVTWLKSCAKKQAKKAQCLSGLTGLNYSVWYIHTGTACLHAGA